MAQIRSTEKKSAAESWFNAMLQIEDSWTSQEIQIKLKDLQSTLPQRPDEFAGQFESQQKASRMLGPCFSLRCCCLLVLFVRDVSIGHTLQVMAALPMAFIGSVAALVLTHQDLTIAALALFAWRASRFETEFCC
ncbi:MAG: hypothetical protein U0936_22215 [Planctomycetaceae bacterium]